jgi:DNA polymerase elongation subunit (family B)
MIYFDIETGPLPDAELLTQFDPLDVAIGNLKDPEKIRAKIDAARESFFEKAALDPLTGRVLAIGYLSERETTILANEDEESLLAEWWHVVRGRMGTTNHLVGFNSHSFDWPFLIRRSWKYGLPVPDLRWKGRWVEQLIDLRDIWQLGDRQASGSLDKIARHLGLGGKNGDGALFYKLWATDRNAAMTYLRRDVELTAQVGERLGVS